MASKDYYSLLGIKRNATDKEIKQAYRRLARQYHPDVNPGNRTAEERFKEIGEAYAVLSDPAKRRQYDQFGTVFGAGAAGGARRYGGAQRRPRPAPGRVPGAFDFDVGGAGDLNEFIQSLFGRGVGTAGRGATRARVGENVEREVEITLEEAFTGGWRQFQVQLPDPLGAGVTSERIEVRIPPGVPDGTPLRVAGRGAPGMGGAPRGDLYLKVKVKPHPLFERDGDDLRVEVPVDLTDAMLGGEVPVPTLGGSVLMTVTPETQNGAVRRLRGQGMPRWKVTGRGDLYAKIKVVLPTGLSERERELLTDLRRLRQARGAPRETARV